MNGSDANHHSEGVTIFAMRVGEIRNQRIGVHPNTPIYFAMREAWKGSPYASGELNDWVDINPKTRKPDLPLDQMVPFIPMEAVSENAQGYVEYRRPYSKVQTGYTVFKKGDIIWAKITPCMQNGKSAVLTDLSGPIGFGSTEYHVLRPRPLKNNKGINVQFLGHLISLSRVRLAATAFFGGAAGQQRVSAEFLEKLPAIVPPCSMQKKLAAALDAARDKRLGMLKEADELLAGIDQFVLDQLGIELPEPEERMAYGVRLGSTIEHQRLDPHRYAPRTAKLRQMVNDGKHGTQALSSVIEKTVSGDWGKAIDEYGDDSDYLEALVIRATEFDDRENLILDNSRVKYRMLKKASFAVRELRPNDILLEKSGGGPHQPVGRVSFIQKEHFVSQRITFTNFVARIRIADHLDPVYLWAFLGLVNRCGLTESMQSQTHGIRNLKMDEYLAQPIPLPPPKVQSRIASEVTARRTRAKQLRVQAAEIWGQAKSDFEAALLGPASGSKKKGAGS